MGVNRECLVYLMLPWPVRILNMGDRTNIGNRGRSEAPPGHLDGVLVFLSKSQILTESKSTFV